MYISINFNDMYVFNNKKQLLRYVHITFFICINLYVSIYSFVKSIIKNNIFFCQKIQYILILNYDTPQLLSMNYVPYFLFIYVTLILCKPQYKKYHNFHVSNQRQNLTWCTVHYKSVLKNRLNIICSPLT